jgi:DNA-directed RNA polymerase subunit RPC12/RpoP
MKCPVCGSKRFFVRDQEDEYETNEFDLEDGQAVFASEVQEIQPETETYCNRCSWHGRFVTLT